VAQTTGTCGFTDPEDLLLHLGQPLEAAFDSEIAARDHDTTRRHPHRGEQHLRHLLKAATGFDLENDRRTPVAVTLHRLLQHDDVLGATGKRQAHAVRMLHDELEILVILVGQSRKPQVRIGKIDAFVATQTCAIRRRVREAYGQAVWRGVLDDAADLAIIKPDRLCNVRVVEYLIEGAADGGWREQTSARIVRRRPSGLEPPAKHEDVTFSKMQRPLRR
jgi:hypothetical protein